MASQRPTILLIDLPPKTFVGLDLISFNSSPNFSGVTNVTPGFHFLYTGTHASLSIRHGRWFQIPASGRAEPSKTVIWKWDAEDESLTLLTPDSNEAHEAASRLAAVRNAQRGFVDYVALEDETSKLKSEQSVHAQISESAGWSTLVSHISQALLNRILSPPIVRTNTMHPAWNLTSISSSTAESIPKIPGLAPTEVAETLSSSSFDGSESKLRLLPIDLSRTFPPGSTGVERTTAARDRSWYLSYLVDGITGARQDRAAGASQIVGELQFTFLMVLTLASYSCLEGWKRILEVVLTCSSALSEVEGFFVEVVRVLRAQVSRWEDVEGGLFDLADENGGAWLQRLLKGFRRSVDEMGEGRENDGNGLRVELGRLEEIMRDLYGWETGVQVLRRGRVQLEDGEEVEVEMDGTSEDEETGDWAPVVVDL